MKDLRQEDVGVQGQPGVLRVPGQTEPHNETPTVSTKIKSSTWWTLSDSLVCVGKALLSE